MPPTCSICRHPSRHKIDELLVLGVSSRRIASQFGVGDRSVLRHKAHLSATLAKAHNAAEAAHADNLLARLLEYEARAIDLLAKAEQEGDYRAALVGIREARACLELLAELTHELDRRPSVNLLLTPQWIELRTTIVETLASYPEACAALYQRLGGAILYGDNPNGQLPGERDGPEE